ncbi:TetR/AcrR family transcriptional regulator [Leucobacter sp. M11]|uniref:TetR/AcrR family transcriptional regulator n=1 Tax=Leucobacter sp. M11 TaxID=2993565 RepID=UPI002D7F9333|nr:TetR/AcrR family transcriptional regulator [Leucobacter sp. M11]MEB4615373.1 TetR/AcrR family transcriptional regulator [Leucobacter sp. M11]
MTRSTPTKRAILDAALELASVRGISGTSMDDVAQTAGVAKGSLYYNFSSKDRLFEALLEEGVTALADRLRERRGTLTGADALRALIDALIELMQENVAFAKLMAAEMFRTDRSWQESFSALRREVLGLFAEVLADLDSAPRSTLVRASAVFGAVLLAGLEWMVFEPELPRTHVVEEIYRSVA